MRLAGKLAIISGAASGMGEATARMLAREGANVVIADLEREGRQVADADWASARFKPFDVTQEENWAAVVAAKAGMTINGWIAAARSYDSPKFWHFSRPLPPTCCPLLHWRRMCFLGEQPMYRVGNGAFDPRRLRSAGFLLRDAAQWGEPHH